MARIYADENFPLPVVQELRRLSHDVLTCREAGQAEQAIPDEEVLAFGTSQSRAVLTLNRWHFVRLHARAQPHAGIIVCTKDDDAGALAARIHQAFSNVPVLDNQLIRINRPPK